MSLALLLSFFACNSDSELVPEPSVEMVGHVTWRGPDSLDIHGDQAVHFEDVHLAFEAAELANGETADLMVYTEFQAEGEKGVSITTEVVWPEAWRGQQVHHILAQGEQSYSLLDGSLGEEPVSWEGGRWFQRCFVNSGSVFVMEPGSSVTTKPIAANDGQIGIKFKAGKLPSVNMPILSSGIGDEGFTLWLTTEGQLIFVGQDGEHETGDVLLGADSEDWNIVTIRLRDDEQGFDMSIHNNGGRWKVGEPLRFEALLGKPEAALVVANPEDSGIRLVFDDVYWVEDTQEAMPLSPIDWDILKPAAFKGVGWVVSADEVQSSQVPENGELRDGDQYDMAWSLGAFAVQGSVKIDQLSGEGPGALAADATCQGS